eukprot:4359528-Amphidinium_carterae.1
MQELPEQLSGERGRAEQETRDQEDSRLPASDVGNELSGFPCYVACRSPLAWRTDQWDSENARIS